jgi:sugar lactone lactonase YvrE
VSIQFRCDQCSHSLAIGTHKAGSTIHCPVCLGMVIVPPDAPDAPSADAGWWQDSASSPAPTPAAPDPAPPGWWLTNTAPTPAPLAVTATPPSAVPPPARKPSEPPPARKPVAIAKPSNRLPALAALGGGFALLLLAGTLAVLALPKEKPPTEEPGGEGIAVQLSSNTPVEMISTQPMPVEAAPPERVAPLEVVPAPVKPVEKEKPVPTPAPPVEPAKTPPPVVEKPVEVKPPVVEPAPAKVPAKIVVKRRSDRSEDDLVKQIKNVPAIGLDRTPARAESTAAIQAAKLAFAKGKTHADTTLAMLDKRADLAGLPLRRGEECRLTPSATNHLDSGSLALRTALASTAADPSRLSTTLTADKAQFNKWQKPEAVPALMQMLMAESQAVREVLVDQLTRIEGKPATEALAQLAVFDLNPRVREQAIVALDKRPAKEYRDILLKGFDHPWPAVADNAAEAVVALKLPDAVPALLSQLDKPDPQAPYEKPGSKTKYVKELVRVNHFLNCLMCHPASTRAKAIPSGVAYYSAPQGQFVRADITYLKQDFSTVLPVEKPGLWPAQQRFDFVVRERHATPADLEAGVARKSAGPTPHQKATFFALRELTGQDPGPSVEDWKKLTLGRTLDVRLRSRGFVAARAVAVDDKGRAYVAVGTQLLRQEGTAKPEVWLTAAGETKWTGLTFDRKGHLLAARSGPADVARIDRDTKAVTSLASRVGGKALNGPRRMAVDKNEGIFFGEEPTDAKTGGIYYVSALGSVSKTESGPGRVRGLDLSPDGKTLYAALGTSANVWAFPVESAGALAKGRVLGRLGSHGDKKGAAVGLAVDGRGLVYVLNGPTQQIEVFGPEGASLAKARLDESPVACALGGEGRRTLYVLTATSLYAVKLADEAKVTVSR